MVNRLGAGTKVGQLGIWDGTQWVAGDPDCNIVKWGGTALTGRDITTLLDHLNVNLDTRARLHPWDRSNFIAGGLCADITDVGGSMGQMFQYTVPTGKVAMIVELLNSQARLTAGAPADFSDNYAYIHRGTDDIAYPNDVGRTLVNVGDVERSVVMGSGPILIAEDIAGSFYLDYSTGGSVDYIASLSYMEWDV